MSDEQQPVAWAAVWPDDRDGVDCDWIYNSREDAEWAATGGDHIDGRRGVGAVVPLYRSPTLTAAEREAVRWFSHFGRPQNGPMIGKHAAALSGLLARLGGER